MLTDNEFTNVVEQFPEIEFGFAYGSGVVKQDGYKYNGEPQAGGIASPEESVASAELPMVDMIFAVEDPETWHAKNMTLNPAHYSPLFEVSPQTLTHIQNSYGAGMWYNAMISMNLKRFPNRLMKYGVIGRERYI
jgi:mitochondrial translocator assembly and maintenance protein 41